MKTKFKKIIITGSAGFIGYHLSTKLAKSGFEVFGIDNLNSYYDISLKKSRLKTLSQIKNYKHYIVDIRNFYKLNKLIKLIQPEYVIHLAAQAGVRYSITNPDEYIDNNLNGFYNILECSKNIKVKRFIYASSSSVYGSLNKKKFSEDSNTDNPKSLYAATKKSNELISTSYQNIFDVNCTGLRFFTVYGPFGRPDMALFKFTNNILNNQRIEVYNYGNHYRDFTYIDDIVDGIYKLLGKSISSKNVSKLNKIYNLGNGNPQKLSKYIEVIEKNLLKKAKIKFMKMQLGDVPRTSADITMAQKDFGYKPITSIYDGIPKFIKWYKSYYEI